MLALEMAFGRAHLSHAGHRILTNTTMPWMADDEQTA
jgi:hypothetical protein